MNLLFRHVPTNDMWSSFLYHSSNPFSNVGNEWKNEKPIACKQLQDITKCFPIITAKGVQCSRDQINLNCEMQASSSAIVISIILSPNAFSNVNTIIFLLFDISSIFSVIKIMQTFWVLNTDNHYMYYINFNQELLCITTRYKSCSYSNNNKN